MLFELTWSSAFSPVLQVGQLTRTAASAVEGGGRLWKEEEEEGTYNLLYSIHRIVVFM